MPAKLVGCARVAQLTWAGRPTLGRAMGTLVLRPKPTPKEKKRLDKGRRKTSDWTTKAWFENGGRVVDDEGLVVIDADGGRHPVPVPPAARLAGVRSEWRPYRGGPRTTTEYSLLNGASQVVAELPSAHFDADDMEQLARAAGIPFVFTDATLDEVNNPWYEPAPEGVLKLRYSSKITKRRIDRNPFLRLVSPFRS